MMTARIPPRRRARLAAVSSALARRDGTLRPTSLRPTAVDVPTSVASPWGRLVVRDARK